MVGLGVFGFVGLWALNGVVHAVDSLPLLPNFLELIGIAFTAVSGPSTEEEAVPSPWRFFRRLLPVPLGLTP